MTKRDLMIFCSKWNIPASFFSQSVAEELQSGEQAMLDKIQNQ